MIRLSKINKSYDTKFTRLHVLKGIDLRIYHGEIISITGPSGSGKSTLLNILGLLDDYDSGEYKLQNRLMKNLSVRDTARYRNNMLGFVFQSANLISYKNILENTALPLLYRGIRRKERNHLAMESLVKFGLRDWAMHYPNELSGGEKQRVAIARALISGPAVILADEPTGQLDIVSSQIVMDMLTHINKTSGTTIVIVTHDQQISNQTNRTLYIQDGKIR